MEFCRHEWVEGSQERASGEEVNPPAPQLARAGAGEHKSLPPARLEEFMDDIQQLGDSLDLAHNDRVALGAPRARSRKRSGRALISR